MNKRIKVLVVDDSLFFRGVLTKKLAEFSNIDVLGYARDAFEAKEKILLLKPDVITLDVEMPKQSGIEFLNQILPEQPIPIVLVSALDISVFDALAAGAVDFVKKPELARTDNITAFINELAAKITIASNAKVTAPLKTSAILTLSKPNFAPIKLSTLTSTTIIALGASTGGTEATIPIIKDLPENTPGILIVQHMPPGFTKMYAERLNRLCKMEVREAVNGDIVKPGLILVAPGDYHMKLTKIGANYVVKCYQAEKVSGHRPSVDVLFDSVAEVAKKNAVGIIMTGMGRDGAQGLLNMRKAGAFTIGQNKESCVVYGMPMVAKNIGAVCTETSFENIPFVLRKHLASLE
ncbi:chemotaxis response regulator protein-glutamate methylesterase [Anaerotignum neopropionicum]|uniref:Protein-glutamate methylesterase/protein-glutamine glutaminase n=1 Tax=Anaerotignum neopropionicum TaxID=36847 RepID=A0A136WC33_9FIRM|nr:chemotaxis response regulator protein-glutamate methylesterase [Anaerotignum neopropionicum]KXL52075.1 chemotaxis response regulator protein-glutamate methylesterase [Anaerotignum neopropionicum]